MRLCFYKGKGRFIDKFIKWWTWANYSHVEIEFSDDICFSSSAWDGGTRFKKIDFELTKWDFIDLNNIFNLEDEKIIRGWCSTQVGKKYDYKGIFGFLATPLRKGVENKDKWFCSEICGYVTINEFDKKFSTPIQTLLSRVSPGRLYNIFILLDTFAVRVNKLQD